MQLIRFELQAPVTTAVLLAVSAHALFKLGMVRVVGGVTLFRRCLPPGGNGHRRVAGFALFT